MSPVHSASARASVLLPSHGRDLQQDGGESGAGERVPETVAPQPPHVGVGHHRHPAGDARGGRILRQPAQEPEPMSTS
jgi:hypothetical protein